MGPSGQSWELLSQVSWYMEGWPRTFKGIITTDSILKKMHCLLFPRGLAAVQFRSISDMHCSLKTHLTVSPLTQPMGPCRPRNSHLDGIPSTGRWGKGGYRGTTDLQRNSGAPTGSHTDPIGQVTQPVESETVPRLVLRLHDE